MILCDMILYNYEYLGVCLKILTNLYLSFTSSVASYESECLKLNYTPWSESASELYRPSDRRLSAK
jgi:hypothetical protein